MADTVLNLLDHCCRPGGNPNHPNKGSPPVGGFKPKEQFCQSGETSSCQWKKNLIRSSYCWGWWMGAGTPRLCHLLKLGPASAAAIFPTITTKLLSCLARATRRSAWLPKLDTGTGGARATPREHQLIKNKFSERPQIT